MSKGVTWMQYFSAETIPTSLDLHPIINLSCLHDMSSSRKKHLSPLAMRVPRRRNVSRQNGHGEQRVAPVENQPPVTVPQHTRGSGPAFVFGEIQVTSSFTFAPRHSFDKVVPLATVTPGVPDTVAPGVPDTVAPGVPDTVAPGVPDTTSPALPLNTNLFPSGSGDYLPRTDSTRENLPSNTSPDEEPMAASTAVVTAKMSNSPTPNFHSIAEESVEESAPVDIPMEECTMGLGLLPAPMSHSSPPNTVEAPDDEQSVLSHGNYHRRYITDRSIASHSSEDPRTGWTDPRSSPMAMSSGEHSLRLDAVEALQRLSNSDNQTSNPPTNIYNQVENLHGGARNDDVTSGGSLQIGAIVSRVQDTNGLVGAQYPSIITANGHLHLPSGEVDATAPDVGTPDLPANPRSHVGAGNAATTPSPFTPSNNPIGEGVVPPLVDTPSVTPLRRVHARGIFIIGNGAPVKIDEGLEVHLRDGVDGQVDFII